MASISVRVLVCMALIAMAFMPHAAGGPLAYGVCQTGCNGVAVACYAAGGYTFGTVTAGTGIPAVLVGCNTALGTCMAACVAAGFTPTP